MNRKLLLLLFLLLGFNAYSQCPFNYTLNDPATVSFSAPAVPSPYYIAWDFGDGVSFYGPNVTHTYTMQGTYHVTNSIIDSTTSQSVCTYTQNVTLTFCDYSYAQNSSNALDYNFNINLGGFPGNIVHWDFGDGNTGSGSSISHTYATGGINTVTVTQFDASGTIPYCSQTFQLDAGASTCHWQASQPVPLNPGLFTLTAYVPSSAGTVSWDFGTMLPTAYGNPAQVAFGAPGTYMVCMTYINGVDTCSYCDTIQVVYNTGGCAYTKTVNPNNLSEFTFTAINVDPSSTVVWTFGDGVNATGNPVNHIYVIPGLYTVCMNELDSATSQMLCMYCDTVDIQASAIACNWSYASTASSAQEIQFSSNGGMLYTFDWNFGDNSAIDHSPSPIHFYQAPGVYVVCLSVYLNGIIQCTNCMNVTVSPATSCHAQFSSATSLLTGYFIDQSVAVPLNVPPMPVPVNYHWDFGDGDTSDLRFPQHTYALPGTYMACLTVYTVGCTDTYCDSVHVDTTAINPLFCTANFVFTQVTPYDVVAVNLTTGNNITFMWDFGDGSPIYTQPYPTHVYAGPGSYNVCLTIADPNGCVDTHCDSLTVDANGYIHYRGLGTTGFTLNVVPPNQIPTGIQNVSDLQISNVYPVPVKDFLHLNINQKSSMHYIVYAADGSVADEGEFNSVTGGIHTDHLSAGLYLLRLTDQKNNSATATFIHE